jgi:PadR family transcriptional regulator, regulatory protein AphA
MDVKTLCLGILTLGEASGYEIKKVFEESFRHFYVAGFGSIYPALADLAREGHVEVISIEQEKRPAKKVYHLTESGRQLFQAALMDTHPHHRVRSDFLVLMIFAHLLPVGQLEKIFDTRLAEVEAQINEIEACIEDEGCSDDELPGVSFTTGFGLTVLKAGRDYILEHRHQLSQSVKRSNES